MEAVQTSGETCGLKPIIRNNLRAGTRRGLGRLMPDGRVMKAVGSCFTRNWDALGALMRKAAGRLQALAEGYAG